jgi:hypothetical protein
MKVSIADCFLQYGESISSCSHPDIKPSHFEWQREDAQHARFVTDGHFADAVGTGQVAWLVEPFFLHPENYIAVMQKPFDYVLTCNDYFVQNNKNWLWCPRGGSWVAQKDWEIHDKTKDISILLSDKKMMYGHRLRHEIVARHQLDVMGLDHYVTKMEALADYRYSIIVENEQSRYWFTEKLIDCFALGTVPIYWGCPDIGRFFDDGGIIEFNDMPDLDNILDWLKLSSGIDYASRLSAMRRNLEAARDYAINEDWLYKTYPFLFGES